MGELGVIYYQEPISLMKIAKKEQISKKYLEHIIAALCHSGLVKSVRGKNGGYSLTKAPENIKLEEIIIALEGAISLVSCIDAPEDCSRTDNCFVRLLWLKIENSIKHILCSLTLKDIVDEGGIQCLQKFG
ncbi:MAG: Rrf2 family transcriptional regulator [Candidatus Omnitrophica bacterium]|nr:Rrf2 family transcriptional regulator [Candidatus Omnitrophota bacterium]